MVRNGEVEATLVKARFGNDVRKLTVHHNDDLSYNDLLMMMLRIFKITQSDCVSLKYKDQEGDLITMADDHDLLLALQNEPSLSLVVTVDGEDARPLKRLQGQLEVIRDSANELLDMLQRMGPAQGQHVQSVQDRPDTPRVLNESVATIQPSVHEQVNNTANHPPAPCTMSDAPLEAFESISQRDSNAVPPAPKSHDSHSFSEPTTEVDITSAYSHAPPPITSLSQHTNGSEHSASSTPMSQGMEHNMGVPPAPTAIPTMAPVPTMPPFGQEPPQATVPPTAVPPVMHAPVPSLPQPQQVQGLPMGAPPPQQYQQQECQQQQPPPPPTQMQQSFGGAYEQQHTQPQIPQGGAFAPPFPSAVPPPPSSTPSGTMFGNMPMQSTGFGQMPTQQQAPVPPPPSVSQMSAVPQQYSASSTPTPMQSAYPSQGFRSGTPSYPTAQPPVSQQQQAGGMAPPPSMPPTAAPPMMPFAGAQGAANPFGRGAGHYARPPFTAFQ